MDHHKPNSLSGFVSYGFHLAEKASSEIRQQATYGFSIARKYSPAGKSKGNATSYTEAEVSDDLEAIRQQVASSGVLYEDPKFPASESSLFPSKLFGTRMDWKRPHEIVQNPKFFVDGASRFDVRQGELGDCWLLAAVSNLTLHPSLFNNIVCPGQSFEQNYHGFFHFRFWRFGQWIDVAVDDRLPTMDGKLVFMQSAQNNEFWSALLEKAYAKIHGSYEALSGGRPCTAMDDFTGGVSEIYDLKRDAPPKLFDIMFQGFQRGSLMACSIEPNPDEVEQRCSNGLIKGHAYSITCIKYCEVNTPRSRERIPLLRVRNPWGNEAEWNGAWSDKSLEWKYVPEEERSDMGLTFEHDGEFWMSYEDFIENFESLEMTNINLESLTEKDLNNHVKHKWEVKNFEGSWVRGLTAGGCANNQRTFWNNPKFYVTLREEDDGDKDQRCTTIVALLQKPRRTQKRAGAKNKLLSIGFSVHPVPSTILSEGCIDESALKTTSEVKGIPSYINHRQLSHRFHLQPGTYCIIPSTYSPDEEGGFMLRVFCEKPVVNEAPNPIGFVGLNTYSSQWQQQPQLPLQPPLQQQQPQQQQHQTNTATAETADRMRGIFETVAGADGEIDWRELQTLLNRRFEAQFAFDGFSKSASRSMVAMLDFDKSGKLGFDEFIHLWNIICIWKNAFQTHDKDGSGKLSGFEFRDALLTSGFRISDNLFVSLVTIYGDENRQITFDDFVLCAIRMSKAMRTFTERDIAKTKSVMFSLEDFMEQALCL